MRRKLRVKRLEIIISSKFYLDENQNWSWVFCVTMAFHARIVFILTCKTCWAPRAPRKGVSSRGGGGGGGEEVITETCKKGKDKNKSTTTGKNYHKQFAKF